MFFRGVGIQLLLRAGIFCVVLAEMYTCLPHNGGGNLFKVHMSPPKDANRTTRPYKGHDPAIKNHYMYTSG